METRKITVKRVIFADHELTQKEIGEAAARQLVDFLRRLYIGEIKFGQPYKFEVESTKPYFYHWDTIITYNIPGDLGDSDFLSKERFVLNELIHRIERGEVQININLTDTSKIPEQLRRKEGDN